MTKHYEAWKVKCRLPVNQSTTVRAIRLLGEDTSSEELTESLIDSGFEGVTVERIYKCKYKIVTAFFNVVFNTTTALICQAGHQHVPHNSKDCPFSNMYSCRKCSVNNTANYGGYYMIREA
ncbi:hypothetical protein FHG87_024172 [Trinorchestia longiramus]|nr:hypothetical protein FHG87_024172 [Trinorchestia longiramus]